MMSPRVSLEKRDYEYVVKMGPFTSQERAAEAEAKARGSIQAASLSLCRIRVFRRPVARQVVLY